MLYSQIVKAVKTLDVNSILSVLQAEAVKPKKELKLLEGFDWKAKAPGIQAKADAFSKTVPETAPAKLALVQKGLAAYAVVVDGASNNKWTAFDLQVVRGHIIPHMSFQLVWTGDPKSSTCHILVDSGEWNLVGMRMAHLKDGIWSWIF